MLEAYFGFECVEHCFDDKSFVQQHLVGDGHEIILHVSADACDQVQTALPYLLNPAE
jgi:hypothetical protein